MSRRGDNIHKRKDGRWEGRYKAGVTDGRKPKYKSVYGKTYARCKEKLERERFEKNARPPKLAVSFGYALNIWLEGSRVRIKESTFLKYRHIINIHIMPELGYFKISRVNASVVNGFLEAKLKRGAKKGGGGLSPSYVRTMAIIIESALEYGAKEGLCPPLKNKINKPAVNKSEIAVLSVGEQRRYEQILKSRGTNAALGSIIALNTGLRIGEVCALHWRDIDLDNRLLYVNHTVSRVPAEMGHKTKLILSTPKTKASKRIIPISSALNFVLESVPRKEGYVISGGNDFVDTRTFEYRFKKLLKDNDLSPTNFHTLRHTFATRCLQYGMDVKTLSEILGHSSAATTLGTYIHPSLDIKRQQLESALEKCR